MKTPFATVTMLESAKKHQASASGPLVRLDVKGMHCAGCVAAVETALARVPGVRSAAVDLIGKRADVRVDAAGVETARLVAAVRAAGYEASPREAGASMNPKERAARRLEEERAARSLLRSAAFTFVVGIAAMLLSMPLMHGHGGPSPSALRWILLAITTPVIFGSGRHFFVMAAKAARRGAADMNTLVALGTGAAYAWSALVTIAPERLRRAGLPADVYFEAIPWVIAFVTFGRFLEERAKRRAGEAVRRLAEEAPATARLVEKGGERDVPIAEVQVGDLVRLLPGARVPVDGTVVSGTTSVDESSLTGEAMPVAKAPGDELLAGTLNGGGSVTLKATAIGAHSAAARVLQLLEDAMTAKPAVQRVVDRIAAVFVPATLAVATLAFFLWLALGPAPRFGFALHAWIATLVVACPCAMGLAVPAAISVATGAAARRGILVRSGAVLETAHRVDAIILDKTGTLTLGRPRVVRADLVPGGGAAATEIAGLAASVERLSEHPLAAAILAYANELGAPLEDAVNFEANVGRGIAATVGGRRVLVGTPRFLDEEFVDATPAALFVSAAEADGATPVVVAVDGRAALVFAVRDEPRPGARAAVDALRALGLRVVMVTGDRKGTAEAIARSVGIEEVVAQALPWDKVELVEKLRGEGRTVAMVGDGLNDAPALAAANLGLAMAGGSGVSIEAADVTILGGRLESLAATIRLARSAHRVIRQNLVWAFGYNALGIPLAAGLFYPWTGWLLSPAFASAAMALSSVSVVTNSLRLASSSRTSA